MCGQSRYNFSFFSNQKLIRSSSEVHQGTALPVARMQDTTVISSAILIKIKQDFCPHLLNRSPRFSDAPATDQAPIPAQQKKTGEDFATLCGVVGSKRFWLRNHRGTNGLAAQNVAGIVWLQIFGVWWIYLSCNWLWFMVFKPVQIMEFSKHKCIQELVSQFFHCAWNKQPHGPYTVDRWPYTGWQEGCLVKLMNKTTANKHKTKQMGVLTANNLSTTKFAVNKCSSIRCPFRNPCCSSGWWISNAGSMRAIII